MSHLPDADIVRQSRREGLVSLAVWVAAAAYSVTYCYTYGYARTADSLRFVWGIPAWVFWGILVPWTACTVFSIWFASFYMTDYDWGDAEISDADDAMWQERTGE